jgi:hypothetical protein
MTILFHGSPPAEVEDWLAERQRLGNDKYDEVWDGTYHVTPFADKRHAIVQGRVFLALDALASPRGLVVTQDFNLGAPGSYRVPDLGIHNDETNELYCPTARLVGEVLSPDDESMNKFDFYSAHDVAEILIIDPVKQFVSCYHLSAGAGSAYWPTRDIAIVGVTGEQLQQSIRWPA